MEGDRARFESVHERLNQIVEEVSAEDISLDDALKLYEEAVKLGLSACDLSEQDIEAHIGLAEMAASEEPAAEVASASEATFEAASAEVAPCEATFDEATPAEAASSHAEAEKFAACEE